MTSDPFPTLPWSSPNNHSATQEIHDGTANENEHSSQPEYEPRTHIGIARAHVLKVAIAPREQKKADHCFAEADEKQGRPGELEGWVATRRLRCAGAAVRHVSPIATSIEKRSLEDDRLGPQVEPNPDYPGSSPSESWNSISRHDGQSRARNLGDCWNGRSGRGAKRVSVRKSPGSEPGLSGSQRIDDAYAGPASPRMNPSSKGPPHFRQDSFSERSAKTPTGEIDVLYRLSPTSRLEVTVPERERWYWNERVERYVTSRNGVGENWRRQVRRAPRNLPGWFERLGFETPTSASGVTLRMVEALRDTPLLAPCSRQNWTSKLRGFLASEGCPLSTDNELWFCGAPVPRKRPYLEIAKAKAILNAAKGRERLVVVLGLFNGLRVCEMSRLRVRDLELDEQPPTMWVLGKGARGGRPRRIPINPSAYAEIEQFIRGRRPEDPVYPGPFGAIDKDWRRAQRRAGFVPVGTHALRRSFGRISHDAGTPTAEIQAVYGHAAESTTSKYIGVEEQRMARGMAQMATYFEEAR